ncbi:hypothetical protein HT031_000600 [Scenedesmus sp. PABB004]|nr:hypothetical protein HT031_000600 [Scenedesmus sp. PABB004]
MQSRVAAARPARAATVVVRASAGAETSSRRNVLGLVAAGIAAAALAAPQQANALVNPAQESYGGLGRAHGKAGSSPKSPTRASMSSYTLEGTKKQGITPKRKAKLLAKAKKEAAEVAKANPRGGTAKHLGQPPAAPPARLNRLARAMAAKARPGARRAGWGPYGSGSDDDEEYLAGKAARNPRRLANSKIDFSKLDVSRGPAVGAAARSPCRPAGPLTPRAPPLRAAAAAQLNSLQRYRKAYKLPDPSGRDDLLSAIMRHFSNVYVDEDETLIKFAMACRRNGQRLGLAGIGKKPRTGSVKPKVR